MIFSYLSSQSALWMVVCPAAAADCGDSVAAGEWCVSLDSALSPAAKHSCAVRKAAACLYTRNGQEID